MKITLGSLTTIFIMLFVSSCMKDSPSVVALDFLQAIEDEDYDRARKLSTEETGKMINLLESLSDISDQSTKGASTGKPEILNERIEGDTAYVEFRHTGDDATDILELRRVDGRWLAHVTKDSLSEKELIDTETSYDSFPEPADPQ